MAGCWDEKVTPIITNPSIRCMELCDDAMADILLNSEIVGILAPNVVKDPGNDISLKGTLRHLLVAVTSLNDSLSV